jgi:ATP-dependent Lon protease
VRTVLIPEENVKDLQEIPDNAKSNLEIMPVKWIDQVLELALERVPEALPDEDGAVAGAGPAASSPTTQAAVPAAPASADGLPH